jgi:galactose mutarotase-like enzyme
MNFRILSSNNDQIVLSLVYSEETLKKYPYKFELQISYSLVGRKLTTAYKVVNHQNSRLYFSLGAHPGFTCPLDSSGKEEKYEDYFLEFNKPETLDLHVLKGGLVSTETIPYLKNETVIPLSYELFKNDALVFKNYKSEYISLKHKSKGEIFKFHFADYPFLGIWSKPGPFICIEPWYGVADFTNHNGILEEKIGIQFIDEGKTFECEWAVEIQ